MIGGVDFREDKLLPSIAGRESQFQCLTSFLIDERVAVDGGSIGFALSPDQMRSVGDTYHALAQRPYGLAPDLRAEAFTTIDHPITVYGTEEVIAALREFIFNDKVWPNFEKDFFDGWFGSDDPLSRVRTPAPHEDRGMNVPPSQSIT